MKKDIQGKQFGSWKVLSYIGMKKSRDIWLCRCVCGKIKELQQRTLLNGSSTSCGCVNAKNKQMSIQNKKFGKLQVISFAYTKDFRTYWNCLCDCGKTCVVQGKKLTNGNTKSCGCINHGKGQIRRNIKNKRFGSLIAKEYRGVINNHSVWNCLCDCGNTVDVDITSLLTVNTQSCGCKQYPETDTKELSEKFNKHATTIKAVKRKLFGSGHNILTVAERKQMQDYFAKVGRVSFSQGEKELASYIKYIYRDTILENDRDIIAPKELDIYIPKKNVAIEYNGLYWHSEGGRCFSNYHLAKTKLCKDKGIRLIHIYENEWRDKRAIVKSMLASALGIYKQKEYARKMEVREVLDKALVKDFFNTNHIQGAVQKYSLCLGLYKGDELVQAVVFGKQHFVKNGDFELYRMATKLNTQVLGGFSKLMEHCPYDKVVSYVALRLFDAKGYLAGKWKIAHQANPSFCITDGANTYSRHLYKKDRCLEKFDNVNKDMTEREMQMKNGLYRLWDCGTYKVVWKR